MSSLTVPIEALARLGNDLSYLKERYDDKASWGADDQQVDLDRFVAHQSLFAVINFIDSVPEWKRKNLSFALERLMHALTNIEQGTTEKMLEPVRTGKRPQNPMERDVMQGYCAAAVEILMRADKSKTGACEHVFRDLGEQVISWLAGDSVHKPVSWRTVARWRDKAKEDKESMRGKSYIERLELFESRGAISEKDAESLLWAVKNQLPYFGAPVAGKSA